MLWKGSKEWNEEFKKEGPRRGPIAIMTHIVGLQEQHPQPGDHDWLAVVIKTPIVGGDGW